MKKIASTLSTVLLVGATLLGSLSCSGQDLPSPPIYNEEIQIPVKGASKEQVNSVSMLNYLSMLSGEINYRKNNRVFMEEAYETIINNTEPGKVDERTQVFLNNLLDTIERYRMISLKRERLNYYYDQRMAEFLKDSIPTAESVVNTVASSVLKFRGLITPIVTLAIDAYNSYSSYEEMQYDFLKDGWSLDDEASENLHVSRKNMFNYMIDMVRDDNIPSELTLNEKSVEKFIDWKNNDNSTQRLHFLESEYDTYKYFASYWSELSKAYYEVEDYEGCIESLKKYQETCPDIFRKDYTLAKTIPGAIDSAKNILSEDEYVAFADKYLDILIKNIESDDWSMNFFAGNAYIDLNHVTNNNAYLERAYNLFVNNVNNLVKEQQKENISYLEEVKDLEIPGLSKKENDQLKAYNDGRKKSRKTELPPVYSPLVLNLDYLMALSEKLNISSSEKDKIEKILHKDSNQLFLTDNLDKKYSFKESSNITIKDALFEKTSMTLPLKVFSENTRVKAVIKNNGVIFEVDDWTVDNVTRPNTNMDDFTVKLTSKNKNLTSASWKDGDEVTIKIYSDSDERESYSVSFKAEVEKLLWLFDNVVFKLVK